MTSRETIRKTPAWRIGLLACAIVAIWCGSRQYSRYAAALSEYRRLNNLVGDLHVDDPTKATIMRMPPNSAYSKIDRWRVYLPETSKYSIQILDIVSPANRSYHGGSLHVSQGDVLLIGHGEIDSDQGMQRISFAGGKLGSTSQAGFVSDSEQFEIDPRLAPIFWSAPSACISHEIKQPICLKAVYRRLRGSSDPPILTSAIFICPSSSPTDTDSLVSFAPPFDHDVVRDAAK